MSDSTMGDPRKCRTALTILIAPIAGSLIISPASSMLDDQDKATMAKYGKVHPLASFITQGTRLAKIGMLGLVPYGLGTVYNTPWPHKMISGVWKDCDGGGKLKRALDKAGQKLFPNAAPHSEAVPIPISRYAVSAEASYQRATSFSSISKGVLLSLEAGALAVVGFALMRGMPTSGATAGFGATTNASPFSSDQNQIL